MRLIKGLPHTGHYLNGCALTIGNFDGVHLGHQAVINKLAETGRTLNLPAVLLTFEPQPLEFFLGDKAPARITRLREKAVLLSKLPVDDLAVVRFNNAFAGLDAEQFVNDILVNRFNVKYLVVGDDFRFGKNRQGDFASLKQAGGKHGFTVTDTETFKVNNDRISSTAVRTALAKGDITAAESMLGHRFSVCGRVVHGNKRGRELGFPTANINLARLASPVSGVFAVTVSGITAEECYGVANIGVRPTLNGSNETVLEVHLFDFNGDIYGKQVSVNFLRKLRNEQRFATLEALRTQIGIDVAQAHKIFAFK